MSHPTDQDELIRDAKSLTQDVAPADQSLEDILAEYGVPPRKKPQSQKKAEKPSPKNQGHEDKILPFPNKKQAEKEDDPIDALFPPNHPDASPEEEPETEGMFAGLLHSIDRRAQQMYVEDEEMDPDEVRRLEELIPGTDLEDDEDFDPDYVPLLQRLRRTPPPPPDIPPRQLAAKYHKGLFSLRLRGLLVLVLAVLSLVPLILPYLGLDLPSQLTADPSYLPLGYAALLGLGMLLSCDLLLQGLWRGLRLKIGYDTLLALCCAVNLADCLYLADHLEGSRTTPYTAINLLALWLLLQGKFHKRMAQHLSCRSAAAAKTPYLVTLDEKKWNAMDTYCKWSGTPQGFGSQMQMDDGGQKLFSALCPLLLVGCGLSLRAVWGDVATALWTASATLTAACALGAPLCYGRSAHKLEQRLSQSGATLAGWSGAIESKKGSRVLLTDSDLFPAGSIAMKQPRYFKGYSDAKIVAYTASLLITADCGLSPLFANYLRSYGGLPRKVERPLFHEGGGISGHVWHDDVLVGSATFMKLMGVPLQAGLHINQTVFCAVNGELAGMFPLSYTLPPAITPAVYSLLGEDIAPILATRDFNLIPAVLSGRFNLPAEHMDFPVIERRRELSDPDSPHNPTLTAVLCREGLLPFAEAVVAAKRLRIATRVGGVICGLGSVVGIALTAYLTASGAYSSASTLNLLVYLLLWSAPVWFLTEWSHRF